MNGATTGTTSTTSTTAPPSLGGLTGAIARLVIQLIDWLHGIVPNYPLDIFLLTLLIKALMFPLTYTQIRASVVMSRIQPKVKELQKKYADDKQKLGEELMKLYQEHRVNPLAGCLPVLLQLPIFFGLYKGLLNYRYFNPAFQGAPFLWVKDISQPDPTWITPIVVAVATYVQMKLSQTPTGDENAERQMKMMIFTMPILFAFIAKQMPVGVAIYWVSFAIISVIENRIVRWLVEKEYSAKVEGGNEK